MREVAFIKQNKEKWIEFEQIIQNNVKKSPDDMADLHIKITNDLAYAKTYYPKSNVTSYLNKLAKDSYAKIYHTKKVSDNSTLLNFFLVVVPLVLYKHRKYVLLSFVFFFVCFFIGLLSTFNDQDFAKQILGSSYVNTTLENIKSGDALAVYKGGSTWGSFIGILDNNLRVGLKMFLSGVFVGVGTGYYVVVNGVMVAVFQAFFYQQNSFLDSIKGIWIHGTFEIFAMIIEASCGYIIAGSVLFPGSLTRFQSFKRGFREAFFVFISTIPFTVSAAFLEGYVTRYYNKMPAVLCFLFIFSCMLSISYYYLILPFRVAKKHQLL